MLKSCAKCRKENDVGDHFCIYCGNSLNDQITKKPSQETNVNSNVDSYRLPIGCLVLPDTTEIQIDQARQLVGRADLIKFTNDVEKIPRRHFAIFRKNNIIYLENLTINDQPTPCNLYLNGVDVPAKKIVPISDGDLIKAVDVELKVKSR